MHTKPASADEMEVFGLGLKDVISTNRDDNEHILPLPEVLQIADIPYLDRPLTIDEFPTDQASDTYVIKQHH